jgi:putative transposase
MPVRFSVLSPLARDSSTGGLGNQMTQENLQTQNRTLDAVYPIVYFDALVVKVRQDGRVINKTIHLAGGVNLAETKELLGLWMTPNESAKF